MATKEVQSEVDAARSLSQRYIEFINGIGSGADKQGKDSASLFAKGCKKYFNGRVVAEDRESFVTDLLAVFANYGSWQIMPVTVLTALEDNAVVLHINVEGTNVGRNTAIVILRYDARHAIKEIIEVFSPLQENQI